MPRSAAPHRFRDPHRTELHFLGTILVRCPACNGTAHVAAAPHPGPTPPLAPRRLVCPGCGLARKAGAGVGFHRGPGPARDPYFGSLLRLQTPTRHGWIWAYNLEHLELIRRFVAAPLRERRPWYLDVTRMTVPARLPVWIKRAKNRDEVLRAVDRVRTSLGA